jgi:GNAT superfamily N-acetyltransferase
MGDFSSEGLRRKGAFVAEVRGLAIGWAALVPRGEVCWLGDLWVQPEWIGTGIGTQLFRHMARRS